MQVTLHHQTTAGSVTVPVVGTRFIIGGGNDADYQLSDDSGIANWHAAICRAGEDLWLEPLGETFVNGQLARSGAPLNDQDEIRLGNSTRLIVGIERQQAILANGGRPAVPQQPAQQHEGFRIPLIAAALLVALVLGTAGVMAFRNRPGDERKTLPGIKTPEVERTATPQASPTSTADDPPPLPPSTFELYSQMTEARKRSFIKERAQEIALAFSKGIRPYEFEGEAVDWIKEWVGSYQRRLGKGRKPALTDCRHPQPLHSAPPHLWHDDLQSLYSRASCHAPMIYQAFRKEGVSEIVGLYIVMIETEYNNLCYDNTPQAKAAGMFQFTRDTAKDYHLSPDERCDAPLMAGKAALYLKRRQLDLGSGQMSIPLAIASYNRGVGNIDKDLLKVVSPDNERSFWDLKRNSSMLPTPAAETLKYVPKFFAAAIIGENPEVFGLTIHRLSSYRNWPDGR